MLNMERFSGLEIDCRFLDALSDAILIYDRKNYSILYASLQAADILGLTREEIMSKTCKEIFGEDFSDDIKPQTILEFKLSPVRKTVKVTKIQTPDEDFNILIISPGPSFYDEDVFYGIVGVSRKMKELFEKIKVISQIDSPVLITGETGTGKELVADIIHKLSPRSDKPLVKINCSAFPENLLESELFGYKKGAFTGADKDKQGKFEVANGGTLFLDEIGDLSLTLQPKILRAVEKGEIQKLGDADVIKVDVRVISATNKKIEEEVSRGNFRSDLYFRLSVFRIDIPPLRERKEDIIPIAELFLQKLNKKYGLGRRFLTKRAVQELLDWDYPGNVRELENILERAYIMSNSKNINEEVIVEHKRLAGAFSSHSIYKPNSSIIWKNSENGTENLKSKADVEKERIYEALLKYGSISDAAKSLNLSRVTLWRKMKKYGINWK
jgi:transcriptional regulator with PAS, ATPase and Fis domain